MSTCDKELLVTYLYDECDAADRARVEAHAAACAACERELRALRDLREDLAQWAPPERPLGLRVIQEPSAPRAGWRAAPRRYAAWGLAAAALLVVAASAGLANLDIRYGAQGLVVRTGWARGAPDAAPSAAAATPAPWRTDLAALERQLRREFSPARPAAGAAIVPASAPSHNDADLMKRVRALLDDSERRQQRELALRVAELVRDMDAQRRADLLRIQQGFGRLEGLTGAEVARQREMLNYLVRVSSQRR